MKLNSEEVLGKWTEYTLENGHGMKISILNYGGRITKIMVPDREGKLENVVLAYDCYENYVTDTNYFGALIGRVAGRISGASFELNGKTYSLGANEGENHLHGGTQGFHQKIWNVYPFHTENTIGLKLSIKVPDGEGDYPGNLVVVVTYTLNNDNQLIIDYYASSDQSTPVTLTNHTYFNLSGNLKNTVHSHQVTMNCNSFIELDEELIPTGKVMDVEGSLFDFRHGRSLKEGLSNKSLQNEIVGHGYDHYFIFDDNTEDSIHVKDTDTGRVLTIETNQPGVVMYTGNSLGNDLTLKEGSSRKYLGVCFETQASPISLLHKEFPDIILKAGETYNRQTVFSFGTDK
ncbi:aldose epimerase family protein [Oceanobacillus timonensis]|uniref:aldose epimerase family protein n=1 Tax=Oceanobacillus timonensis TaxID=1926285 RepID=UPI0009B9F666|nr:aldose epimerase family protein [Oceanobacillus timonensis]